MAKSEKSRPGFVIKLSCETVQKLSEEEQKCNVESKLDTLKTEGETCLERPKIGETVTTSVSDGLQVDNCNIESKLDSQKTKGEASLKRQKIGEIVSTSSIVSLQVGSEEKKQLFQKPEPLKTKVKETRNNDDLTKNSLWDEYAPYITYEGKDAIYTDPTTKHKFVWNHESNSWDAKDGADVPGRVYSYEDDAHTYTEADGSKFFWDAEKKAWLPKVDDDFLAYYQMAYGFVDNTKETKIAETEKKEKEKKLETGMKRKNEPQWFDQSVDKNTKVYVSNLPLDITEEEFVDLMQKCGLVERDVSTQKMKVKLYMDKEHNCFKGDALCTYIKIESVDLALKLLDGCDFKGNKIKVERAQFQLKGEYNPALKPKKKKKKELEKIKKMQQKLFDWRPEKFVGERSKHERIVIIKNLFHPTDFDKEVQLILDYQQDLREECSKCGEVRKVVLYDRHPEGVAQVTMKEPEQADAVVALINGRWFGKRQITAEIWDGRTKYRIAETDADINKRINKWDKFLEGEDGQDDKNAISGSVINKTSTTSDLDTKQILHTENLEGKIINLKQNTDSATTDEKILETANP